MREDSMFVSRFAVATFVVSLWSGIAVASNQSVAEQCAAGGPCVDLVKAEIQKFSGTPSQIDSRIADLVVAIGERAQGLSPNYREGMADGVDQAATFVSNAEQKGRVEDIAKALRKKLDETAALPGPQRGSEN